MNTIWLKVAALAIGLLVVVVIVSSLTGNGETPANPPEEPAPPRTYSDMTERDRQFLDEPMVVGELMTGQETTPAPPAGQTAPQPVPTPQPQPAEPPAQPAGQYVLPSSLTTTTTLYFKPLDEIDDIAAQQQMPWATTGRSLGRLPVLQYGSMVKTCRDILEQWPESLYAFRAKQLLEEIYERHAGTYNITEEELDISKFLEQRPGTQGRRVEPIQP